MTAEPLDPIVSPAELRATREEFAPRLHALGQQPYPQEITSILSWARNVYDLARYHDMPEESQLDALELVRRSERALGMSIRLGQAAGLIASRRDNRYDMANKHSPLEYASRDELSGNNGGIYRLADGWTDEEFDQAILDARVERNLKRANLIRKLVTPLPPTGKLDVIKQMAEAGYTSKQIAPAVEYSEEHVRNLARQNRISIPADVVTRQTRHIRPERVIRETVHSLEGLSQGLGLLAFEDYDALDPAEFAEWGASLTRSLRAVRALQKELKLRAQS